MKRRIGNEEEEEMDVEKVEDGWLIQNNDVQQEQVMLKDWNIY